MRTLRGGLGDKVEDWVERLHQTGIRLRLRFRTLRNQQVRAIAKDKAHFRSMHPDVIAKGDAVKEGSKRNLTNNKMDPVEAQRKRQREVGRSEAMQYFERIKGTKLTWKILLVNGVAAAARTVVAGAGGIECRQSVMVDGVSYEYI